MTHKDTTKQTQAEYIRQVAKEAVIKLKDTTDENTIKTITIECWELLNKNIPKYNYFRGALGKLRKAIEQAFPSTQTSKPGYYFTPLGKGKDERYEHLALWYATESKKRWDVVGDEARAQYFKSLKPFNQVSEVEEGQISKIEDNQESEVEKKKQQPEQVEQVKQVEQVLEIEDMTVDSLKLDAESQEMVERAVAQLGISITEFVQKACTVYAKTVTGKSDKHSEDLSHVETEVLRKDKKYSTHPGRAGELVNRAVQAIKNHNGQSTELSQKWLITQSLLVDMTGAKAAAVKAAMLHYQSDIDGCNTKLTEAGATNLLNRKEGKEKFCIDWVYSVTSGID